MRNSTPIMSEKVFRYNDPLALSPTTHPLHRPLFLYRCTMNLYIHTYIQPYVGNPEFGIDAIRPCAIFPYR